MVSMKSTSYTALRANLAKKMQEVCEDHEPLLISRSGAKSVVVMSLEDYQELTETNYLFRSPVNATRLAESIEQAEKMIKDKKSK